MTRQSIYTYLQNNLRKAINYSFPYIDSADLRINFFYKIPDRSGDLGTPVALRIAAISGLHCNKTASLIMSRFNWDNTYVEQDRFLEHTIKNGFINFSLSTHFLYENLRNISCNPLILHGDLPAILEKTGKLLGNYFKDRKNWQSLRQQQTTSLDLLKEPEELKLIRLIAVAYPHTPGTVSFFIQKILSLLILYYRKYPILTSSEELTSSRILLTRAVHNHLCYLLKAT